MKVHTFTGNGCDTGFVNIEIGQEATVFRCGGYSHGRFGEKAKLGRVTSQHLIWITESGAEVKTSDWNLFDVRGKAAKAGYIVSLKPYEEFDGIIHENVGYWNSKKMCFEKK